MAQVQRQLQLGPFDEGLNLRNWYNPHQLDEKQRQCPYILNMDPKDGYLESRKGYKKSNFATIAGALTGGAKDTYDVFGPFFDGNLENYPLLMRSLNGGANTSNVRFAVPTVDSFDFGALTTQRTIAIDFISTIIAYNNSYWLFGLDSTFHMKIAQSTSTDPTGTYNAATTGVTLASTSVITKDNLFVWRDRVWYYDKSTSTVYFSKATDPATWSVPDGGFFRVGDKSDPIRKIVVTRDIMYIFKSNSTYEFYYYNDPNTDGFLKLLSSSLGGLDAVTYKDQIYVLNAKGLFGFDAGQFTELSHQIGFGSDGQLYLGYSNDVNNQYNNHRLSLVNDQIFIIPLTFNTKLTNPLFGYPWHANVTMNLVYLPDYNSFTFYSFDSPFSSWDPIAANINPVELDGFIDLDKGATNKYMYQSDNDYSGVDVDVAGSSYSIPTREFWSPFVVLGDKASNKVVRAVQANLQFVVNHQPTHLGEAVIGFSFNADTVPNDVSNATEVGITPKTGNDVFPIGHWLAQKPIAIAFGGWRGHVFNLGCVWSPDLTSGGNDTQFDPVFVFETFIIDVTVTDVDLV